MKRNQPTAQEKQLATEMQTPEKPVALTTNNASNLFQSLLNQPTIDAQQLLGGGKTVWIDTRVQTNELFPTGGDFSLAFFVLRAWYFESKTARNADRFGAKIAMSDGQVYHISLAYPYKLNESSGELEPMYTDRQALVEHFKRDSTPVGIMQFQKIDRGQSNPYWRLIYADQGTMELAGGSMPAQETTSPDDTPF